jgi:hypothetical protein
MQRAGSKVLPPVATHTPFFRHVPSGERLPVHGVNSWSIVGVCARADVIRTKMAARNNNRMAFMIWLVFWTFSARQEFATYEALRKFRCYEFSVGMDFPTKIPIRVHTDYPPCSLAFNQLCPENAVSLKLMKVFSTYLSCRSPTDCRAAEV